jgi:carboxyl-terminal processing protease
MSGKRWIVGLPVILFVLTIALGGIFLRDVVAADKTSIYAELSLFNEVLNLISEYYVEPVPPDSLIEGAIVGMLERLDPHSNYMDAERYERMDERNRGTYSGIGISFGIRDGQLTVISPMEGGPSYDLGIRPGDVITHIEGVSAFGINEQEVFDKLRGPKGTKVHVTIRRASEPEPLEFDIIRDNIPIQSVPYSFMLTPTTGYIMMRNFSARTAEELDAALTKLETQGMQQLVLDLRGNAGGYLNAAVEVSDMFLSAGKKVVYTQGRIPGSSEEYYATDGGSHDHPGLPIVVLIDHGSASASEIVAGAVQDWDRGVVAGRTSFGKGLVQRQYRLSNDGALLLTVARYYTPSGRLIQRPYQGEPREDYYEQAGSGDEPATTPAPADTASGRPVYHTLVRERPVYGGGGITPDVRISEQYITSRLFLRLSYDRKFFDFAKQALDAKEVEWEGPFIDYAQRYEVSDKLLNEFKTFLQAGNYEFEPDTFAVHADEMKLGIRAEIARYLWGEEERYRVIMREDPAMQSAIDLVPAAEAMLSETQRLEALAAGKAQR